MSRNTGLTLAVKKSLIVDAGIILRGRMFSKNDLDVIHSCVDEHFDEGRTAISRALCRKLNWKQPNGWLKDRACRDVLLQLEALGFIILPSRLTKTKEATKNEESELTEHVEKSAGEESVLIIDFPKTIELVLAKGNKAEKTWNDLINKHHYLGHRVTVGRCLKYLVRSSENILGAVAFSSPAWRLEMRDTFLKKLGISLEDLRDVVINNTRFLILPQVQIPNLASTVLSAATKQIVSDWKDYYSLEPMVVETFVQPSRFKGTCYKASNWIEIGRTKGYAKQGASYHNSQEPKQIFLYGLNKKIRRKMLSLMRNDATMAMRKEKT